jgi:hypothetical protein
VKPAKPVRPKLPKVSEEMKAWSAALAAEITTWPKVSTRVFFGFTALYRGHKIFAILPRTRAMGTPNSLAFKLGSVTPRLRTRLEQDVRIGSTQMRAARWLTFEFSSDADLRGALDWLTQAYEAARNTKKTR